MRESYLSLTRIHEDDTVANVTVSPKIFHERSTGIMPQPEET